MPPIIGRRETALIPTWRNGLIPLASWLLLDLEQGPDVHGGEAVREVALVEVQVPVGDRGHAKEAVRRPEVQRQLGHTKPGCGVVLEAGHRKPSDGLSGEVVAV